MREPASLTNLGERELCAFVAGVEAVGAEIDGIGAVGERGANRIERSSGGQQFGNASTHHHFAIYRWVGVGCSTGHAPSLVGIGMGYTLDTWGWKAWQFVPIPFAIVGALLMTRIWNATPKGRSAH